MGSQATGHRVRLQRPVEALQLKVGVSQVIVDQRIIRHLVQRGLVGGQGLLPFAFPGMVMASS